MDWSPVFIAVGVVLAIGVAAFGGLVLFASENRRDMEGARIQQALAAGVAREPALGASRLTFDVDIRRRGPVCVTVTGQVPSPATRKLALHVIDREAARLGRPVHVSEHVEVVERLS